MYCIEIKSREEKVVLENSMKNGQESGADDQKPKRARSLIRGFLGVLSNVLLLLMFSILSAATWCLLFLNAVAERLYINPMFGYGVESVKSFITSLFPSILGALLSFAILFFIIVINRKPLKKMFLAVGMTFLVSGLLYISFGFFAPTVVSMMNWEMKDLLYSASFALGNFFGLIGILYLVIASVWISLFFLISYVKSEIGLRRIMKYSLLGLALILIAFVPLWIFMTPSDLRERASVSDSPRRPDERYIAERSERIDYNPEDGAFYVNNEIIVIAKPDARLADLEQLAKKQGAEIDLTMSDIGVYKFSYETSLDYEELNRKVSKIKKLEFVEDAYLSLLSLYETDAETERELESKQRAYPDDDWGGGVWNTKVPRGNNWGMEAIDAPGAWGYLDQMSEVRVGLIDAPPNTLHEDLTFANVSRIIFDSKTNLTSINTRDVEHVHHGAHVSGIMAADWNNRKGISGVTGGKAGLYYSAVFYFDNRTSFAMMSPYSYLLALKNLIDQDVRVINISLNTGRLNCFAASRGNKNAIKFLTQQSNVVEKGLSRMILSRKREGKTDFVICMAAGNVNNIYYYKDDSQPFGYREEMTFWERILFCFGWRGEIGNALALYNNYLNLVDDPEVRDRIIVVGSVGIDLIKSLSEKTVYSYSAFSNVGDRVDIVAPGEKIYSCMSEGYAKMSGTSMSAPHVSGVAGLIFACNPDLSGPDVKRILLSSTSSDYYYHGGKSGLVDAKSAVEIALQTRSKVVEKVLKTGEDGSLDLCFVVDTTASMGDDIENTKENMTDILDHLADKTKDYRVALIDYRDFESRTGDSADYPSKLQLNFTDDNALIKNAINALRLGNGGDDKETVYSALKLASGLGWREKAKKVIIILGDAAPLDPEPFTNLTFENIILALFNADISVDYNKSDKRVVDSLDPSLISVYSIGTNASYDAADFFQELSNKTGGVYSAVEDASGVSDAIIESIEQIEIVNTKAVDLDFGDAFKNREIDIYRNKEFLFTIKADERARFQLDSMEEGMYRWQSRESLAGGTFDVDMAESSSSVRRSRPYWFSPVLLVWDVHKADVLKFSLLSIVLILYVPLLLWKMWKEGKKMASRRAMKRRMADGGVEVDFSHCPACRNTLPVGAKYCGKCGSKIVNE